MKAKQVMSITMAAVITATLAAGCGSTETDSGATSTAAESSTAEETTSSEASASEDSAQDFSGQSIEVDFGGELDDTSLDEMESLVKKFADQTGSKIEVVRNGDDHEQIMKTRMASNSMPDIWSTHGWSTIRYNDFLLDLADQPWVSNMDDGIATVVTDANGKVCSMPITLWTYGMVYDKQVLEDNGIDPYSLTTWDAWTEALDKLKNAGITPIEYGDKEGGILGGILEMANSFYTIEDAPYASNDELKNGTFDWTKHQECLQAFADLYDAGYYNDDIFTTDQDTVMHAMGNGTIGFKLWASPQNINTIETYTPDREYGILPIPAVKDGGHPAYTVGEGFCLGISKDTKYPELCKALLNYLAQNEVMTEFIKVNGNLPGMKGVEVPDNKSIAAYNDSINNVDNIAYSNFFDREYLPSGMWGIMEESVAMLYNNEVGKAGDSVQEASEHMQENYVTLYQTSQSQ